MGIARQGGCVCLHGNHTPGERLCNVENITGRPPPPFPLPTPHHPHPPPPLPTPHPLPLFPHHTTPTSLPLTPPPPPLPTPHHPHLPPPPPIPPPPSPLPTHTHTHSLAVRSRKCKSERAFWSLKPANMTRYCVQRRETSINQSFNRSINQSINQSTNQSTKHESTILAHPVAEVGEGGIIPRTGKDTLYLHLCPFQGV